MDYSKYGISNKRQKIRGGAKKAEKKFGYILFRIFIICIILCGIVGVSAALGGVKGIIDSAPEINVADIAPKGFKSYIYNIDGEYLHEIVGTGSNRIYVTIDEMGENVPNAFIALEDERFRSHNGIDPRGIVRAFFVGASNGFHFSEGASTITQQLLKLSVFSGGDEPTLLLKFRRKFQEQYLALELEKQLTKDEILEAYLNTINLGQSCYGVEAAANYYFAKSADELTISEAAVLAGIAQSPTGNNPVLNPKKNNQRRETTINYMYNQGLISEDEKQTALNDTGIYDRIEANAAAYKAQSEELYTYYEEAAIEQVIEDLQTKLGLTYSEAFNKVYSGALKIYLAQDETIQEVCEAYYADDSNFPMTEYLLNYDLSIYDDPNSDVTRNYNAYNLVAYTGRTYPLYASIADAEAEIALYRQYMGITEDSDNVKYVERISYSPQIQSSFVVIDQTTGYVSAMIAGRGEKTVNFGFNRVTDSTRQPGSTFKIVSTYAPALDYVGNSLATSKVDKNVVVGSHTIRNVDKYESGQFLSFREAIKKSKNTVAVRTLQENVGYELALKYLTENFHFSTMDMVADAVDVLAIGGTYNGVTNLELTAAFASIANGGIYMEPSFYTKVLDADDNVILDRTNQEGTRAIKETTAFLLTDAMVDVVTVPGGTAYGNIYIPNMAIAGKTGTTDDWKDTWFVGYSPYYTAGIWFGYDNNISPDGRYGWRLYTHEHLWDKIYTGIIDAKGLQYQAFEVPEGIIQASVCKYTGLKPGSTCKEYSYEYMDSNNVAGDYCTECMWEEICKECGGLAGENSKETESIRYSAFDNSNLPTFKCDCEPETEAPPEETPGEGEGEGGGGAEPPVVVE